MSEEQFRDLRKTSQFVKKYGTVLKSKRMNERLDLNETKKLVNSFVISKRNGGQRLTHAGALLLISPDPFTGAIAVPLLLMAQVLRLRSKKKSDIQRILEGANGDLTSLLSLSTDDFLDRFA